MGRAQEYEAAEKTGVKAASARAFAEIKLAQYWLREADSKNFLLGLVQLVDDPFPTQRRINFEGFGEWSREQMARNPPKNNDQLVGTVNWPEPGMVVSVPIFLIYRHTGIVSDLQHGGKPMVISTSARSGGAQSWIVEQFSLAGQL